MNSRWSNVRCKLKSYISTQISSKCKVRNCYFYTVRYIDTRYHMKNVWYQILIPWMTTKKILGTQISWFSCMVNTIRYHTTSRDFQTTPYFFWTRSQVRCSFFGGCLKWCICHSVTIPPPKKAGFYTDGPSPYLETCEFVLCFMGFAASKKEGSTVSIESLEHQLGFQILLKSWDQIAERIQKDKSFGLANFVVLLGLLRQKSYTFAHAIT